MWTYLAVRMYLWLSTSAASAAMDAQRTAKAMKSFMLFALLGRLVKASEIRNGTRDMTMARSHFDWMVVWLWLPLFIGRANPSGIFQTYKNISYFQICGVALSRTIEAEYFSRRPYFRGVRMFQRDVSRK